MNIRCCAMVVGTLMTGDAIAIKQDELLHILETAKTEMSLPGVRAAVLTRDGSLSTAAIGYADVEQERPLDDTLGMPGGSTGKSFFATLTLLLVEDGTLSLNDPVSKWLGHLEWYQQLPNADTMEIHHLLSHTSGIPDYPRTLGYNAAMVWRALAKGSAYFTPEELIGYVTGKSSAHAPGEGYLYSDAGYLVLGRLIEAATGRDIYDLLEERILNPHALTDINPARTAIINGVAAGYSRGARNLKKDGRMKMDPRSEWTGGGLVTTPTMLVQFFAALQDGTVLKPETFQTMLAEGHRGPEAHLWRYGLGVFVFDGGESFGHEGMWPGYRSIVVHFFTSGTTIAVQTNRDGPVSLWKIVNDIAAQTDQR
ncbi:MAG: serine hydrolase domain-containing protein [Pseudomonadota bacterium]